MMQGWVDAFYDQFVDRVAEGRRLSREQVDAVGRGRVWTGRQAQERGLVDRLGGLEEAIRIAKARAGIAPDEGVRLDDPGKTRVSLGPGLDIVPAALHPIPERSLRALSLLGAPGTLRAALPFDLEVN